MDFKFYNKKEKLIKDKSNQKKVRLSFFMKNGKINKKEK